MNRIRALVSDTVATSRIDTVWDQISGDFETAYAAMPRKFMERSELSFHSQVKLLGLLCLELQDMPGDVVEIGVWKGKSLALMQRLTKAPSRVIGIDPCELPGQPEELRYFQQTLFPACSIIQGYSQLSIGKTLDLSQAFKLLHIDGGHFAENVWMDFLIYERFVVPGGYVVFDDYDDPEYSPDVRPTVDRMRKLGVFKDYDEVGEIAGYENSFVLHRKRPA